MNRFLTLSVAILLGLVSANQISQKPQFLSDLTDVEKVSCYIYKDLTYFDYTKLYEKEGYTYGNYSLNFCKSLSFVNADNATRHAYAYKNESGNVTVYAAGGDLTPDVIEVYDLEGVRNVRYTFNSNQVCSEDQNQTLSATYEITCNEDDEEEDLDDLTVEEGTCKITIKGSHKHACAEFQATAIVDFLTEYPWVLGAILIAFGTVSLFLGAKFFPYIIAVVGGGVVFFVILVFASVLGLLDALDTKSSASTSEIAIAVTIIVLALALSIFVGWFVKKVRRIGGTISAAAGGFFAGFMLYNLVFASWWNHVACLLILSIGLAVAAGYISWKYDQLILVYTTAIIGSYALVRGVSIFTGNFPNEITTYQEIMAGTFVLSNYFYIYLVSIIAASVVGVLVQRKLGFHEQKTDDEYHKIN